MHKYVVVEFKMPEGQTCMVIPEENVAKLVEAVANVVLPEDLAVRGCYLEATVFDFPVV